MPGHGPIHRWVSTRLRNTQATDSALPGPSLAHQQLEASTTSRDSSWKISGEVQSQGQQAASRPEQELEWYKRVPQEWQPPQWARLTAETPANLGTCSHHCATSPSNEDGGPLDVVIFQQLLPILPCAYQHHPDCHLLPDHQCPGTADSVECPD